MKLLAKGSWRNIVLGIIGIITSIAVFITSQAAMNESPPPIGIDIAIYSLIGIIFGFFVLILISGLTPRKKVLFNEDTGEILLQGMKTFSWKKRTIRLCEIMDVDFIEPEQSNGLGILFGALGFAIVKAFSEKSNKPGLYFKLEKEEIHIGGVTNLKAACEAIKNVIKEHKNVVDEKNN